MSLMMLDRAALAASTSRVIKRADCERLIEAEALLHAVRDAVAAHQTQLDALRREAQHAGHAAGVAMGKAAWAQQLVQQQLARQDQFTALRAALLDVVMSALRHLIGALPDAERFERLAEPVLESAIRARRMRLVVAPTDAEPARAVLERWRQAHGEVIWIDVTVDHNLAGGDCVLETDEGAVDGRLAQRLQGIEAALSQRLSLAAGAIAPAGAEVSR
jgi:flagellar biosynthesis/type III secretory pathway protein FliH